MKPAKVLSSHKLAVVSFFAIIAMVAITIVDGGTLTGNTVAECYDSDPLADFYVRGYAEYRGLRYDDTCSSDGNRLYQYYCETSIEVSRHHYYQCPYGCQNGACLDQNFNCGDGIKSIIEQCDDGNSINGDGCSDSCSIETGFGCTAVSVCRQS
ncbi:MAG TPA: myxococcus cysteine-rich repeat containing protein [Candidatus Nanoarchaeia archaeon]|nr:myxococcus cysteine-rich repeat containing protein [Candidatus Nanoarchaeia archaeon]